MTADTFAINVPAADHLLVRQVATGDQEAFGILYDQYYLPVYNYILRLVHEPQVAEELLQEAFLALWQGAKNFREEAKVKTWLLRIAHHRSVSWLRRSHPVLPIDEVMDAAADDQIEQQIFEEWEVDRVQRALEQLSLKHRAVIELAFVHNLPYADIAVVLDCPIGTVKSRMSYAMRHLGALLKLADSD